jgi:hypothetical protein
MNSNRPLPQWVRLKTDNTVRYVKLQNHLFVHFLPLTSFELNIQSLRTPNAQDSPYQQQTTTFDLFTPIVVINLFSERTMLSLHHFSLLVRVRKLQCPSKFHICIHSDFVHHTCSPMMVYILFSLLIPPVSLSFINFL